MKYYIGFAFAFALIYFINILQNKFNIFNEFSTKQFVKTQSSKHIIKQAINSQNQTTETKKETQSRKHEERTKIRVIIVDNQAYWVKDNVFYTADMVHGDVDKETTRTVDTMAMNKVQLDKMIFIMDRLQEGNNFNDSGSTGY
jgi:hypothetical protein